MISLTQAAVVVALLGQASHFLFFCRVEVDHPRYSYPLATAFLLAQAAIPLFAWIRLEASIQQAVWVSVVLQSSYLLALSLSISVYRLFLHPTRSFPGPFWARLSAWWKVVNFAKDYQPYLLIDRLHKKHGDAVRIGLYIHELVCLR
jgi:hypothetical protein